MKATLAVPAALVVCLALPARAEVKIEVREDGRKVIVNESSEQRSRRLTGPLVRSIDSELLGIIEAHAFDRDLDPRLVQAVIQAESGYNVRALSNKGAMGLMQLMPGTASELAVADPYDPSENVRGGTEYLRRMLDRFDGQLDLALAAYNAGPEAVGRHAGVPPYPETQVYVDRVLALYRGEGMINPTTSERVGRPVRLTRDANNRIRIVTIGNGSR